MISVYMADIGDGMAAGIRTLSHLNIQIDCGSQQSSQKAFVRGLRSINPDIFFLSHFHVDHYNGLLSAANSPQQFAIKQVYFPRIPEFPQREVFLKSMLAMNRFLIGNIGTRSGSKEGDFLHIISRINNQPFRYKPLSSGDIVQMDGVEMEVLWPPRILKDGDTLTVIQRAVSDFEAAKNEDELLQRIYEELDEEGQIEPYVANDEHLVGAADEAEDYQLQHILKDSRELPEAVKRANDALRAAANHISLAIREDNRFLFMGDLEEYEIKRVVHELLSKHRDHFLVLITPHHGTHWHKELGKLHVWWALSSIGPRLLKHARSEFKTIAHESLFTHLSGDIEVQLLPIGPSFGRRGYGPIYF